MTDAVYEFHVAGLIGPVIRSALPELTAHRESLATVVTGRVDDSDEVARLLRRLTDHGMIVTRLSITDPSRRRLTVDEFSSHNSRQEKLGS